jgi:ankyrin repeat protein
VRWLIAHGADLNHTAKYHLSALMLAVINGRDAIVGILVDAGADRSLRDRSAPGFEARPRSTSRGGGAAKSWSRCWKKRESLLRLLKPLEFRREVEDHGNPVLAVVRTMSSRLPSRDS